MRSGKGGNFKWMACVICNNKCESFVNIYGFETQSIINQNGVNIFFFLFLKLFVKIKVTSELSCSLIF